MVDFGWFDRFSTHSVGARCLWFVWLATDERRSNRLAFSNDERVSMSIRISSSTPQHAQVNTLTTRIPTHASTHHNPSVLRPSPHPLRILLPLPPHIPEPPSTLSLPTNPRIEPQKRKRVALAQHLLSLSRPLPLTMLTLARYLSTPFSPLNWLQRRRRRDDAGGEDEDRDKELDGDVEGERGIYKSCRVLVGGVDAG